MIFRSLSHAESAITVETTLNHQLISQGAPIGKEDYESLLEYNLYTAMIYIGLKKWKLAIESLTYVICASVRGVVHSLMLEAYKKWILASLIFNKKV
jgi:COP9 signalosome complex subunit 3